MNQHPKIRISRIPKLTWVQACYLMLMFDKIEHVTHNRKTNKSLKKLIDVGLVKISDATYKGLLKKFRPILCYSLTPLGEQVAEAFEFTSLGNKVKECLWELCPRNCKRCS